MKKIKYFLNIRKLPFRFLLLLFSVGSGIGLVWVGADKIYCFFDSILAIEIKSNYSFIALLLGSLTFLTLWFFRTYDVREQIGQQDFHDALRMLADDKLVSQEIAVLRLIDISKKTKVYDDTIKTAFIKRMKAPYKEAKEKQELTNKDAEILKRLLKRDYARYIFCWIKERYKRKELDLRDLDLRSQYFIDGNAKTEKLQYFIDKNNEPFFLWDVNLSQTNLLKLDLRKAFLCRANLQGAILNEIKLQGASLESANFLFASLGHANLSHAILYQAKELTYEQLASVKSLYKTQGLETVLKPEELTRLKVEKPELFEPPKEEQNET